MTNDNKITKRANLLGVFTIWQKLGLEFWALLVARNGLQYRSKFNALFITFQQNHEKTGNNLVPRVADITSPMAAKNGWGCRCAKMGGDALTNL